MKATLYTLIPVFVFVLAGTIQAQTLDLKIMSFNVQQPYGTNWDGRKAGAAGIINTENCDVIGTQEAVSYMRDYLITNTSGYTSYGSGRDGGDAGEASYIFYKTAKYSLDAANSGNFWMSNTPTVPSRFGGEYNRICTYVRLVEISSGKGFYLFNIHNYMPGETAYRLSAAKLLAQRVAARAVSDPVYITGDFNSSEGDAVTIWMKSGADNPHQCRDTYRDFDPTGSVTTGFGTKFDYIYCPVDSKYTTVSSKVILTPVASDHHPIVATVKYSGDSTPPKAPQTVPGKIEAESYSAMQGIQLENCTDTGAGQNMGYLSAGNWFTYAINVTKAGKYTLKFRTASAATTIGKLQIQINGSDSKTQDFVQTGGWQTWSTTTTSIDLSAGVQELKFVVLTGDVNINWFEFSEDSGVVVPGNFELKAQTQNLWRRNDSWPNRLNNVVSMIKDQAPDFISITEGDEGKAPELANLLTNYTLETGPWKEESTCIIYNHNTLTVVEAGAFGYSSTPDVNKASDWGDGAVYGWLRKCNWILFEHKASGEKFYVYNNHLDALNSTLGPAYWRRKQVELMAARIAARTYTQYPFMVTGDLNEHETDGAIVYLKSGAGNPVQMEDTYRQILPGGDGYTFGSIKLDYILIEKNSTLKALDANVVYQSQYGHLSDHNSIWAALTIGDSVVITPFPVPGKIQAEAYQDMSGIQLESTTDTDGGQNIGFLTANDWFTYSINVSKAGKYKLDFRTASMTTNGKLQITINNTDIKTQDFTLTGGWQTWETTTSSIDLSAGVQELKLTVLTGDFNINWFEFTADDVVTGSSIDISRVEMVLYPNPVKDILHIKNLPENSTVQLLNILGVTIKEFHNEAIDVSDIQPGVYFAKVKGRVFRFSKYE